jgi:hypothetical protein
MTIFYCEGTVRVDDTLTSGIEVRLYTRDDGVLVSGTLTTVSGTFSIPTTSSGVHFAIAMSPASGTNSLIYDWLLPVL